MIHGVLRRNLHPTMLGGCLGLPEALKRLSPTYILDRLPKPFHVHVRWIMSIEGHFTNHVIVQRPQVGDKLDRSHATALVNLDPPHAVE